MSMDPSVKSCAGLKKFRRSWFRSNSNSSSKSFAANFDTCDHLKYVFETPDHNANNQMSDEGRTTDNDCHTSEEEKSEDDWPDFSIQSSEFELTELLEDPSGTEGIIATLMSYLSERDIKRCRHVSKTWYNLFTDSTAFWNRFRLLQVRNIGMEDWYVLTRSSLVSSFFCPNYHFVQSNLISTDAYLFLLTQARHIKHLTLDRCVISPTTVQLIFSEFLNLESVALGIMENCVVFCEALHHQYLEPNRLKNLKNITLRSNFERTWNADPAHYSVANADLHLKFLSEMLGSSFRLESLTFSGWGSKTCSRIIELVLSFQRRFLHLTQLHFKNVPTHCLNFEHFELLSSPFGATVELKELSITLFLALSLPAAKAHSVFADAVFREILVARGKTLESLSLDRCPVTDRIFVTDMPNLRKLSLKSTQVRELETQVLLPKLSDLRLSIRHPGFNVPVGEVAASLSNESGFWEYAGAEEDEDGFATPPQCDLIDDPNHREGMWAMRTTAQRIRRGTDLRRFTLGVCLNLLAIGVMFVLFELPEFTAMALFSGGLLAILLFMSLSDF